MNKANYGMDAPGIMKSLLLYGSLTALAGVLLEVLIKITWLQYAGYLVIVAGLVLIGLGTCMFAYGLKGKYRMRDFMLSRIAWTGTEHVLDIGTGQGLLLNGAARHLTTGKAIGIDIWNAEDLTDNTPKKALANAVLEGVADKVEIRTEDARKLTFPDHSFDVILSLLCIHNIEDKQEQRAACLEIARVLKPGGKALIGDYLPTDDYARAFSEAGLQVSPSKTYFTIAYGLMWMVEAEKKK